MEPCTDRTSLPTAEPLDPAWLCHIDTVIADRLAPYLDRLQAASSQDACSPAQATSNRATIVVFSGDMDKLFAAFTIAVGAAASGMQVSMFFSFWGLNALRRKRRFKGKGLCQRLMAVMMPSAPARLGTSRMNMLGAGPAFFRYVMKKRNVQTLPELITLASDAGVRLVACHTSMDVMGVTKEELRDGVEVGGVTTYLADARDSRITLFV
jgi:peroxiredoxin family protein